MHKRFGFTIVEIMTVIAILAILFSVGLFAMNGWQRKSAQDAAKSDLAQATTGLESHKNFKNDYPPNLAGTNFAPSDTVAMTLYTNAPQTRTYTGLTSAQNAQLLLNSCNAHMPIISIDLLSIFNTSCAFSGNHLHVKGLLSSNIILHGPLVTEAEVVLTCGSLCTTATNAIKADFLAQGGTFPITVPNQQVSLPEPTVSSYGSATRYCLEARAAFHNDIVYHTTNASTDILTGECPNDPELHYP